MSEHSITSTQQRRPSRLLDHLISRGLVTQEQLDAAPESLQCANSDRQLRTALSELELVTTDQLVQAEAELLGIPFVRLNPLMVQVDPLEHFTCEYLQQHNLLPISNNEGWLTIAAEHFADVTLIDELARRSGCKIQILAASPANITDVRSNLVGDANHKPSTSVQESDSDIERLLDDEAASDLTVVDEAPQLETVDLEAGAKTSPVVKLVNHIIKRAVEARASDIHIEPGDSQFRVRYRVDGELMDALRPSSRLLPAVSSRIKILAGMDISERRLPQDGGMTVTLVDRPIDLRVSTMATKFGEKTVMRIVDRDSRPLSLDSIGFQGDMLRVFRSLINEANGIVLVTGPTGSGKTTTLYGGLNELVSDTRNISTIEDPVERRLSGTNQFQVNNQAGFTFARALRSLLRQDPDVVMVGEIRDAETAALATEAALTGHLVLSTLHTNSAATAIPRLINMGVEPYLVAATLRGVLAQRLVRQLCEHCKERRPLNEAQSDTLKRLAGGRPTPAYSYCPTGCPRCKQTGYTGRIGVFELLPLNEELLSVVARDGSLDHLQELTRRSNMTTLLDDGIHKLEQGMITLDGLLGIVSRTHTLADAAAA